jgi:hypothetical protein
MSHQVGNPYEANAPGKAWVICRRGKGSLQAPVTSNRAYALEPRKITYGKYEAVKGEGASPGHNARTCELIHVPLLIRLPISIVRLVSEFR